MGTSGNKSASSKWKAEQGPKTDHKLYYSHVMITLDCDAFHGGLQTLSEGNGMHITSNFIKHHLTGNP